MDNAKAMEIIKSLADGIDPFTGEIFPPDSPYQNAEVVRSLHIAVSLFDKAIEKQKRISQLPERAGKPWYKVESDLLARRFDEGLSISDLAKEHKRTRLAIQSQLAKLGKIEYFRKSK